jgi:ABC-type transport system involved in multi-copper enzyme maturation permease subunit
MTFAFLVVIAIALAVTGPQLVHFYDTTIKPCKTQGDCSLATKVFLSHYRLLQDLGTVLVAVPALIGLFWGAPLVAREFETGTYKLVWMQSTTRKRWLAVKLAVIGLASIAFTGLLSLMVTWWSSPIDRVNAQPFGVFDQRDIAPLAYTAFAFALGVAAGVLVRRTIPAMVITLVGFSGVRMAFATWVRPYLYSPLHFTAKLLLPQGKENANPSPFTSLKPGAWNLSDQTIDGAGRVIGQHGAISFDNGHMGVGFNYMGTGKVVLQGVGVCPDKFPPQSAPVAVFKRAAQACVTKFNIREVLAYQPASRYWAFQWYEAAIFVALALVIVGVSLWSLRRQFT